MGGRRVVDVAHSAAAGGAGLFQLRDKRGNTRECVRLAREIVAVLQPFGAPLLINDRVDIALAAGAAGVHLGQEDMAPEDARRILPPGGLLGLTVRSRDEAEAAPLELLDYISIGGVFPTGSKEQKSSPIGLEGLREIGSRLRARGAPSLCAISGINLDNAAEVVRAGVEGVAVISAVTLAEDPRAAAERLKNCVEAARQGQRAL